MDSVRYFSRTDEDLRPTYELIRQGKMPESQTLFGRFLSNLLGTGKDGKLRKQQIDGSLMPDFQMARRYLGPMGVYVQTEEDGWFLVGAMLPKDTVPDPTQVARDRG